MDPSPSFGPGVSHITLMKHLTCKFYNKVFQESINQRTPKLLIFDLYRAEYDEKIKLFNFYNYKFKEVAILGQVVCVQPHRNSFYFEVDDGTAQIRVYSTDYDETRIPVSHFDLSTYLIESEALPANNINNMAKHLLLEATRVARCQVLPNEIMCGDVVVFIGKLAEHEGRRNIFLSNMYRVNNNIGQCRLIWLNDCLSSYNDHTSIYNTQWNEQYYIPEEMTCD